MKRAGWRSLWAVAGVSASALGAVAALALTFSAATSTWDFGTAIGSYRYDNRIEVNNAAQPGVARLHQLSFTDTKSDQISFGNGTYSGTQWDLVNTAVGLSPNVLSELVPASEPNLKGLWHFTSNALDTTGGSNITANTFTLTGTGTDPTFIAGGRINTGAQFDGVNDYLTTPLEAELNPPTALTVETWVKWATASDLSGTQGLVVRSVNTDGALQPVYALIKDGATGKFQFLLGANTATPVILSSTTTPIAGLWYHLAGTYDGAAAKLYVNGLQEAVQVTALTLTYLDTGPLINTYVLRSAEIDTLPAFTGYYLQFELIGYKFTPTVSGTITELCDRGAASTGSRTAYLYNNITQITLASSPRVSNAGWVCSPIAVPVTAGVPYSVAVSSNANQYAVFVNSFSMPRASEDTTINTGQYAPSFPLGDTTTVGGLVDVRFQRLLVAVAPGEFAVGRYGTSSSGPFSYLKGVLDEVVVAAQAYDAATIKRHGAVTYPTTGTQTYTSPVLNSANNVDGVPVPTWRTLTWTEGPVPNLGEPLAPTASTSALYHFDEGAGQQPANAAVPPPVVTATPAAGLTLGTLFNNNVGTFNMGFSFQIPSSSSSRQVTQLGGRWCGAGCTQPTTRTVRLYRQSDAALLGCADVTSTGTWQYAPIKDPATCSVPTPVTLTAGTTAVVAVASPSSGGYSSSTGPTYPVSIGGITTLQPLYGISLPAMPTNTVGALYGQPDVMFADARASPLPTTLGALATAEASDPGWTSAGRVGQALDFDGVDDIVSVAAPPPILTNDNWSLEAWVYYTGTGGGFDGASVLSVGSATTGFGLWRGSANNNTNLITVRYGGATPAYFSTGVAYDLNAWNHLVVTRASGVLSVYKNGVAIGPDANGDGAPEDLDGATLPTVPAATDGMSIGNLPIGTTQHPFGGAIDEAGAYTTALSPATIRQHYQQGALSVDYLMRTGPTAVPDASWTAWQPAVSLPDASGPIPADRPNLKALWRFDDAAGNTATDAVGYGNRWNDDAVFPAVNPPTWTSGFRGGGLAFDGTQSLSVPTSTELQAPAYLTLEARVKFTDIPGAQGILFHPGANDAITVKPAYALHKNASHKIVFSLGWSTIRTITSQTAVVPNQWYHLLATQTPTGMFLYIDGQLEASSSTIGSPSYSLASTAVLTDPLQNLPIGSATALTSDCTYGYAFTPNANGQITALHGRWDGITSNPMRTVDLFRESTGARLGSSTFTSSLTAWTVGGLAKPVDVKAGTSYVVAVRSGPGGSFASTAQNTPTGFINGNVQVNKGMEFCGGSDGMPTTPNNLRIRGQADVRFSPNSTLSQLLLGRYYERAGGVTTADYYLHGVLDEVAIYHAPLRQAPFGATPAILTGAITKNRYAQYQATLRSSAPDFTPLLSFVEVKASGYSTDKPAIGNITAPAYDALRNFSVLNEVGTITYQASNNPANGGADVSLLNDTWYYYDTAGAPPKWKLASADPTGLTQGNTKTDVAAHIAAFPAEVGRGSLYWRAILHSDGDQPASLDQLSVDVASGSLLMTAPAAGAVVPLGAQNLKLAWTMTGTVARVKLEYASDGSFSGPNVKTLTSDIAATGASVGCALSGAESGCFAWNVPNDAAYLSTAVNAGLIRITANDADGTHIRDDSDPFTVYQLEVNGPTATDVWRIGDPHTISWTGSAATLGANVTVSYAPDGSAFTALTTVPLSGANNGCTLGAATGCYRWPTTGIPASTALRTAVINMAGTIGATPVTAPSSGFTVAQLDVTAPTGSPFRVGTTGHQVTWAVSATVTNPITLTYAPDGNFSGANVKTITTPPVAPSPSAFSWDIPGDASYVSGSNTGLIQISTVVDSVTLTATSTAFTVTKPVFNITMPSLVGISPPVQAITWTADGGPISNSLRVEFTTTGGAPYTTACSGLQANDGTCDWIVPNSAASTNVQIHIVDTATPNAEGLSAPFTVAGAFSLLSPNTAGMKWAVGKTHTIQWTNTGAIQNVKVEFSKTGASGSFTSLGTVATGAPNTSGSFSWTPSASEATTQAVIQISDVSNANVKALSPAFLVTDIAVQPPACPTVPRTGCEVGTTKNITWTQTGLTDVKLFYSTDPAGGVPYTEIDPSVVKNASAGTYTWTISDAIKKDTVKVMIQDAQATGEGQATSVSSPFTIYGQLDLTAHDGGAPDWAVNAPQTIRWATPVGTIPSAKLAFSVDGFVSDINAIPNGGAPVLNGANGGCTVNLGDTGCYTWTPLSAGSTMMLRVSDAQDPETKSASAGIFTIAGIAVTAPASSTVLTVGTPYLIKWDTQPAVSSNQVTLEYSTNGFSDESQTVTIATGLLNAGNTGSYPWPAVADAIGTTIRIRVSVMDVPGLIGISQAFTITGQLSITTPASVDVGSDASIAWSTPTGTIAQVNLQYSTDGTTWLPVLNAAGTPATGIANSGSFTWRVPDAISTTARVRVVDAVAGHPVTMATSNLFNIRAAFAITDPTVTSAWAVNEAHDIKWTTAGTVGSVKVEYSTDNFACSPASNCGTMSSSAPNAGNKYTWPVPDLVSPVVANPGFGPANHTRSVQIRISDADGATHPPASATSAPFIVKWYKITWQILNADTIQPLDKLSVNDTSAIPNWPTWVVTDDSVRAPIVHYYPAGGLYTTTWAKDTFTPATITWTADADKTIPVLMSSTTPDPTIYNVKVDYSYDVATDTLTFKSWVEKQGQLTDVQLLGPGTVQIFDVSAPVLAAPLSFTPPVDPGGTLINDPTWDGSYTFSLATATTATSLVRGNVYFVKAMITVNGSPRTSGGTLNITIPSQTSGVTLGELQAELTPVKSDVTAIKGETVGAGSTLDQVKTGVTTTIPNLIGGVSGQVSTLQGTANTIDATTGFIKTETDKIPSIKTETDLISAQVLPSIAGVGTKVDGVQSYLADPAAGLPKIIANTNNLVDQAKAQRRGGILNRTTEYELGENLILQYRPGVPTAVPTVNIVDPLSNPVPVALMLNVSGLYEATIPLAQLGQYRIVVNEAPDLVSGLSAGTVDSLVVTVREPKATATALSGVAASLSTLISELGDVETRLTGHLTTIQNTMATSAQADTILLDLGTLKAKWGTLSAATLDAKLNTMSGQLGSLATTADLQTKFTVLSGSLAALDTELDGLATTGDLQAKHDAVIARFTQLQADIAALPQSQIADQTQRLTDIAAQLDTLETDLDSLRGEGAANVDTILSQVDTVQETVSGLQQNQLETGSLLAQLTTIQEQLTSAEGSAGAAGLAQNAFTAASEAVTLLQQLKTDVATLSAGGTAPQVLTELHQQLTLVASSMTKLPGQLLAEQESQEVAKIAERLKALSSEKGYEFDSLFELSATQAKDVKSVKNHVEELKALLEVQQALLDQNLNQPVIKTWFEAGQ